MSTDNELEPIAGNAPVVRSAEAPAGAPAGTSTATPTATPTTESPSPASAKAAMPKSTRILAMTAGGVVAAAAVFGGGVAFGTSLNSGGTNTAQQGQFSGTPPTGTGGPGGMTGTAPTGAPTGSAGGATTTG